MKKTFSNGDLVHRTVNISRESFEKVSKLSIKKNKYKSEIVRDAVRFKLMTDRFNTPRRRKDLVKCSFTFFSFDYSKMKEIGGIESFIENAISGV